MSEEERIKFVISFSNFINNYTHLFEGIYKLFKNGESEIDLGDSSINLKATNFGKIKRPDDTFFSTMLLMYLSMKQLEANNVDEIITVNGNEMLELENFIEYARNLPYFKDFIKENK